MGETEAATFTRNVRPRQGTDKLLVRDNNYLLQYKESILNEKVNDQTDFSSWNIV